MRDILEAWPTDESQMLGEGAGPRSVGTLTHGSSSVIDRATVVLPTHTRHKHMTDWHTQLEKDLIVEFGGEPTESYGADGMIDGEPVEVRLAKEEDRFRVNRDTHGELLEGDGSYIFDNVTDDKPPKEIEADEIDDELGDDWFSDRGYQHQFLDVDDTLRL